MANKQTASFDYIVVGAGSAGCVLAARLSEDPSVRVLLLEAGGWDRDPFIHIPLGFGKLFHERRHDWSYDSAPEAGLNGRALPFIRGKVIGGSSSINAMAYVRGHRDDYDRWARAGLTGWSYESVLPYFKRQESWAGGANAWRGGSGPLHTRETGYRDPLDDAFVAAGVQAGFATTPDYNGAVQEGFGRLQQTIQHGRRASTASAYLRPALGRAGLVVQVGARATRIVLQGSRAVGVEYLQHGQTRHAHATNEIILAGGVFNSPHLLMLSGIGPAAVLHRIGIAPLLDLPGVGANLQDHCAAMFLGLRRHPGPFHHAMRADRIAGSLARAYMFGSGFAADVPGGSFGFLKSDPSEPIPDIQLILNLAPPDAAPYLHPRLGSFTDGFNCMVALLRPHSRGGVSLASADPLAAPVIRPNLLAAARDLDVLKRGLRIVRDLAASFPLQAFIGQEIVAPGTAGTTDAALEAHIRTFAVTVNHPLGTCKMGTDRDREAVVDDQLRVRGAQGLRVVDASVMPDAIGGNINAAVIMIAERAADLIKAAADPAAIDTRMAA